MKYLFFVAWLRAREKKIADSIDFDRMIGAPNPEESFKVLNDTDYAPFISGKTYLEIEEIIEKEKNDLKNNLAKMGLNKGVLSLIFLKDELILLAEELKEELFKDSKKDDFIKKYSDIAQKIKKKKPTRPEEIDNLVIDIYFRKSIKFCAKSKEKNMKVFFKKYWKRIKNIEDNNLEEREAVLFEMEEKIIEKSAKSISGIMPILAFFIKKKRAESFIRTIFSAQKIGLDPLKTYNSFEKTRIL